MDITLTLMFTASLLLYLGVACSDLRYHRRITAPAQRVPPGESVLHVLAGLLMTGVLLLLVGGPAAGLVVPGRAMLLGLLPVVLGVIGLFDELMFHRPRCAHDPKENWQHALMHMTFGFTLLFGYLKWYPW
jgi:hypothetical protein